MSNASEEVPITKRVRERPSLQPSKLRDVPVRDLGYRFVAGALTSLVAGALTIAFGARIGGPMLAFPAILAASLTLIEEQEDSAEAREDARGATVGAGALAVFAAVAAVLFKELDAAVALALATAAWLVVAMLAYAFAWLK